MGGAPAPLTDMGPFVPVDGQLIEVSHDGNALQQIFRYDEWCCHILDVEWPRYRGEREGAHSGRVGEESGADRCGSSLRVEVDCWKDNRRTAREGWHVAPDWIAVEQTHTSRRDGHRSDQRGELRQARGCFLAECRPACESVGVVFADEGQTHVAPSREQTLNVVKSERWLDLTVSLSSRRK